MTRKQRIRLRRETVSLLLYIFTSIAVIILVSIYLRHIPSWALFCSYALVVGLNIGAYIFYFLNKQSLYRMCVTTLASIAFLLGTYLVLLAAGVFDTFTDIESIKQFVQGTGAWGCIVFVVIQAAQVVFLPIPGMLVNLTGVALYGATWGFLLCLAGLFIGSAIAFFIGKVFGKRVVEWIAGKAEAEKYRKLFEKKGKFIFILMLIFPIFPDDLLCMVAGVTTMRFRDFFIIVVLTRPWGLALTCYFGSGEIIPFRGWGLWVWGALAVVTAVAFYVINRFRPQIESFCKKLVAKKHR